LLQSNVFRKSISSIVLGPLDLDLKTWPLDNDYNTRRALHHQKCDCNPKAVLQL
jgi:hypothetical protein